MASFRNGSSNYYPVGVGYNSSDPSSVAIYAGLTIVLET